MIIRLAQLGKTKFQWRLMREARYAGTKTALIFYNEGAGSRDTGYTAGRLPFRHDPTSTCIRT
jgi:hypothetical protein